MDRDFINATAKCAELIALELFVASGRQIAIAYGNQKGWDFLIEDEGRWLKVQVKTAKFEYGYRVGLERSNGLKAKGFPDKRCYTADEIDVLAAVHVGSRTIWLLPSVAVAGRRTCPLTGKYIATVDSLKRGPLFCEAAPLLTSAAGAA